MTPTPNTTGRTLRFRAWYKPVPIDPNDVQEWEQPKMYYDVQKLYDGGIDGLGHVSSFGTLLHDAEYVLMQSTGLHDRNGKEIFEGDIVQFTYRRKQERAAVEWSSQAGYWAVHNDRTGKRLLFDFISSMPEYSCVVIGNNFENPELLPKAA